MHHKRVPNPQLAARPDKRPLILFQAVQLCFGFKNPLLVWLPRFAIVNSYIKLTLPKVYTNSLPIFRVHRHQHSSAWRRQSLLFGRSLEAAAHCQSKPLRWPLKSISQFCYSVFDQLNPSILLGLTALYFRF